jgi:hypothetical protein
VEVPAQERKADPRHMGGFGLQLRAVTRLVLRRLMGFLEK